MDRQCISFTCACLSNCLRNGSSSLTYFTARHVIMTFIAQISLCVPSHSSPRAQCDRAEVKGKKFSMQFSSRSTEQQLRATDSSRCAAVAQPHGLPPSTLLFRRLAFAVVSDPAVVFSPTLTPLAAGDVLDTGTTTDVAREPGVATDGEAALACTLD